MGYRAQGEAYRRGEDGESADRGTRWKEQRMGCKKKLGTALIETSKSKGGGEVMGDGARRERVYEQKK